MSRLTLIMHGIAVMMYGNSAPAYNVSVPLPGQLNPSLPETPCCKILVIFGCAAADTGPNLGTIDGDKLSGDGPALLRKLAVLTGTSVRAADRLQQVALNWYM